MVEESAKYITSSFLEMFNQNSLMPPRTTANDGDKNQYELQWQWIDIIRKKMKQVQDEMGIYKQFI